MCHTIPTKQNSTDDDTIARLRCKRPCPADDPLPIRGLELGCEGINRHTRCKNIVAKMTGVGCEVFRIQHRLQTKQVTNSGQTLSAMVARIDNAIAGRWPDLMFFEIGITWNPPYRWANAKYGYSHDGFDHMEIPMWAFGAQLIGCYETALIKHFLTHAKCLN